MNINVKRSLALLLALVLCIGLLPATQIVADAADFEYVYDSTGKYIYNWGTRGETATSLSPNAEAFYTSTSYDALSQKTGGTGTSDAPSSALYAALQSLMKSAQHYETSYKATTDLFQYTDCQNSGNPATISSFYSGKAIGPTWDSGATWNREHTWPNSKGDASGNGENDIMMLRPTASTENSSRGNKAYGESGTFYHPNSESDNAYDLRGDVSRILLYVYVRWGNTVSMWGSEGVIESLDILLKWMQEDPVDTWEMGRNDSVQSITGTRNVFVDYPEFAFLLFGAEIPADLVSPTSGNTASGHTHAYTSVVTAPTCTAKGYTTYTCACGYSYKGEYTDMIAHNFEDGICSVCGQAQPTANIATMVTDINSLQEGDQIIIVAFGFNKALGTTQNSNNRNSVEVTKEDNTVVYGDTVQIINLEAGAVDGTYAFCVDGGYLYAASGSKNYLRTQTTNNANGSWKIEIASSGVATIKAQGSNARNWLRFNDTNNPQIFSCYGSGQADVAIYKLGTGEGGQEPCQHSYSTVVTAPTCTEDGYTTYTCTLCGDSYIGDETPATGHNYVGGICANCGQAQPSAEEGYIKITGLDQLTSGKYVMIVSTGYAPGVVDGTWISAVQPTVAGDKVIDPKGGVWTLTVEGTSVTLQDSNGIYVGPKGGNTNGIKTGTAYQWKVTFSNGTFKFCGTGDDTVTLASNADSQYGNKFRGYKNTTVADTAAYPSAFTLYKFTETETEECTHTNTKTEGALAATCTVAGHTGKTVCADCGETISAGEEIPALGHDETNHSAKAPTCTEPGWDAYVTCSRCDYTTYAEKPATGHDYDTVVTAPSCTEGGYTTYTCSVCGDSYTGDETSATGHDYDTVVTAPTCTATGYTTYTCSVCEDSKVADMVPALGHDHQPQVIAPTCTEPGYTLHKCSRCEDSYTTNPVAALGHTEVSDPAVAPTCVATGLTAGIHCGVCGEVLVAQTEVPATGEHTYDNGVCTGCGRAEPACSHTNTQVLPGTAPTCTEPGWTDGEKCSDCGEVLTAQEEIPALGHDYVGGCQVDLVPTEKTEGHLTGACVVCSQPVEATLPALNMVAYAFTVVTAPADGNAGTGCFTWNETAYGEFSFEVEFRYGDVNGDGVVNGQDVVLLRKFMANYNYDTQTSMVIVFAGADVNGDGKINGQDVVLLRRYMANYDYDTGISTVPLGPQD